MARMSVTNLADVRAFEVNPVDLPSPPVALARVVRLASDPDVTSEQLGAVVASDPAFTAELLRTVNSPFYGLKQPVTAARRAVTVIGIRALRNLAICFAVRDSLSSSGVRAEDLALFWEDSLRRAVAARVLARATRIAAPDEAFTLGLLQDFGMLALLHANRNEFANWPKWRTYSPDERRAAEVRTFQVAHDDLARQLGARWGLPAQLLEALAFHHAPDDCPPESRELARLAGFADMIAALIASREHEQLQAVRTGLRAAYNVDADTVLEPIAAEVEAAATALGMRVTKQPDLQTILSQANRTLVAMNASYEELAQRLERALAEKEQLMARLAAANAELERVAYFDPLTGLCNRRRFETVAHDLLSRAALEGRPISLIVVDLDRFKSVNDTHGHATGDAVLRMTAAAITHASADADLKARLGGEELAVLLPDTDAAHANAAAERLRLTIARGAVTTRSGPLRVTASLGVATFQGSGRRVDIDALLAALLEIADKALYRSKAGGRDRVTFGGALG